MANYIRVSTIGMAPCEISQKPAGQDTTDYVLAHLQKNIEQVLNDSPDLIVLPEACDRPKGMELEAQLAYYEERGDRVLHYLQAVARRHHCYVTYPAYQKMTDNTARNACMMLSREGKVLGSYYKNHLVIDETFESGILCGKEEMIFECDFGRVGAAICFDLNFEEIRKRLKQARPDLIVFPSAYHGGLMQRFFAYDTRSYFVGAIVGEQSDIISPLGEKLAGSTNYFNYVTAEINLDYVLCHLDYNWEKLDAAKSKYGKKIKIHDPGYLGVVMITGESSDITAGQVADEFEIELLDHYLTRALEHRANYTER